LYNTIIFYRWGVSRFQAQRDYLSQLFAKFNNNNDKYYPIFIVDDLNAFLSEYFIIEMLSKFRQFSILDYKQNFSGEISKESLEELVSINKITIKRGVVVGRFLSDFSVFNNKNNFHFLLCDSDVNMTKSEGRVINNLSELPIFEN